jgi:hypothetical protein
MDAATNSEGAILDQKPTEEEPTLVERWLQDQQEWQKTALAYLDSMVKNDDFLVHLGNAMRGSLLAGKPYPSAKPAQTEDAPEDGRIDEILHALRKIEGQLNDLRMNLDELRADNKTAAKLAAPGDGPAKSRAKRPGRTRAKRNPAETPSS